MARKEVKGPGRQKAPPEARIEYLLNETYTKIDELKELLRREESVTGFPVMDPAVDRMFVRQDYLVTRCAEACIEQERRAKLVNAGISSDHRLSQRHGSVGNRPVEKSEKAEDANWYGSLDRNFSKKKKQQLYDKRRRHTKTIGSMAGLDVIKKSQELKPDERYEIGLPAAPRVVQSRSSIFPMTQHQYYSALMSSKLSKVPLHPLEMRSMVYPMHQQQSSVSWGHSGVDENRNLRIKPSKSQIIHVQPPLPSNPINHRGQFNRVPLGLGSSTVNQKPFNLEKGGKSWFETNLDESVPKTPVSTLNLSPSPSVASSNRGSSPGSVASGIDTIDAGINRITISSPANESADFTSKSSESSETWSGNGNEVTKPFEMSDYYKYSMKFRSQTSPVVEDNTDAKPNTTRIPLKHSLHSRYPGQVKLAGCEEFNYRLRDSSVGPKLPPKQKRNVAPVLEEEGAGDSTQEIWITNKPTFV